MRPAISIKLLLAALLLDLLGSDPPNRWHPVAWMGTFISYWRRQAPVRGKFIYGGCIAVGGAAMVWRLGTLILQISQRLPAPLRWLTQAWLLKTTFSLRGLNHAAWEVEAALRVGDLITARQQLSWHLVSRETATLTEAQVAAAAIESVAENSSDGIIAPLFWYGVGGLPAALTYRYLQTSDSLLGYRDPEREWLGKIPARLDDLLNIIPARLTALLFVSLHPQAAPVWWRDGQLTASPNAGHPMSAMAGSLDIELEKVGHYRLNAGRPAPQVKDIRCARHLMIAAVALFTLGVFPFLQAKND